MRLYTLLRFLSCTVSARYQLLRHLVIKELHISTQREGINSRAVLSGEVADVLTDGRSQAAH